jgi:hypothetical protein
MDMGNKMTKNKLIKFAKNIYIDDNNYVKLCVNKFSDGKNKCIVRLMLDTFVSFDSLLSREDVSKLVKVNDYGWDSDIIRAQEVQAELYKIAKSL